jgi:hypothetical protein
MAITSKPPQKSSVEPTPIDDDALKQLINKGGTPPPKETPAQNNDLKKVQLRLPQEILDSIDTALEKRNALVRPSRHTWLLEAIAEKLDREGETVTSM